MYTPNTKAVHCWLGDRKGIRPEKPVTLLPKVLFRNSRRKQTKVEPANPGPPGKSR